MKRKTTVMLMGVFFLFCVHLTYAGIFASGGGESRRIDSLSVTQFFNTTSQDITLVGDFSKKQGRDRRVVISPDRLPTPFPVAVISWNRRQIQIRVPQSVAPGNYRLFLERAYRKNGSTEWRVISNTVAFVVRRAAQANANGAPHAAPIYRQTGTSLCYSLPKYYLTLTGGPFQVNGQPVPMRAEIKTTPMQNLTRKSGVGSHVTVLSPTRVKVEIGPSCLAFDPTLELRLIYPDRSASNWIPAADSSLVRSSGSSTRHIEPLRK